MEKSIDAPITFPIQHRQEKAEVVARLTQLQDQLENMLAKQAFYRESMQAILSPQRMPETEDCYPGLWLAGDWVHEAGESALQELLDLKQWLTQANKNDDR